MVKKIILVTWVLLALLASACTRSNSGGRAWRPAPANTRTPLATEVSPLLPQAAAQTSEELNPAAILTAGTPVDTPTPDLPRSTPTPRTESETYVVQPNDSLGMIARNYSVSIDLLIAANQLDNPDILTPGQEIIIPAEGSLPVSPSFKVLPDSELVYGPSSVGFDPVEFVRQHNGYLANYSEDIAGVPTSGAEILLRVTREFSVNPRVLLAVLEYRSGWVTRQDVPEKSREYPALYLDPNRKGLYKQLAWVANSLNYGYYLWRAGVVPTWALADGALYQSDATINAATAGVQGFFSLLYDEPNWKIAVSEQGLFGTYARLFGYPFNFAFEPVHPEDLAQPPLQLPFEEGARWYMTGGPHAGWASGSAWAAIDFAPDGELLGCIESDAWVTAMADGIIVRTGNGAVVQDLDGDGFEQTGWTILYMHLETRDRVAQGTMVKAGDRLGHPSCEGGYSTGTHTHLARRYNGEWISADGALPFNLDGWISSGDGYEYDGWLSKDGTSIEALDGRKPENEITRAP